MPTKDTPHHVDAPYVPKLDIPSTEHDTVARWAQHGALMHALLEPDLDTALTPTCLLSCDNHELFTLLPLVLPAIQKIGEFPGQEHRALFVQLVDALRTRVSVCRAVKLRLLLLTQNAGYASFWTVKLMLRTDAYSVARTSLRRLLSLSEVDSISAMTTSPMSSAEFTMRLSDGNGQATSSSSTSGDETSMHSASSAGTPVTSGSLLSQRSSISATTSVSRFATRWFEDKKSLRCYAFRYLFHPTEGVQLKDHMRHFVTVKNSFKASELVDMIVEHANFSNREQAVPVGQMLQDDKLIVRVGHPEKPFADTDKLYKSNIALHRKDGVHALVSTIDGDTLRCWEKFKNNKQLSGVKNIELKVPSDMVDLQSLGFWTRSVYLPNPVKGHRYGYMLITHPVSWCRLPQAGQTAASGDAATFGSGQNTTSPALSVNNESSNGKVAADQELSGEEVGSTLPGQSSASVSSDDMTVSGSLAQSLMIPGVVGSVVVRKVFSSIARPMIIELQKPVEECWVDEENAHEAVSPSLLVKEGDNLGQDMCIEIMFRCFNMIWEESPDIFPNVSRIPQAYAYEVFPTDAKRGFMEALTGLTSLKDFDWDEWTAAAKQNEKFRLRMIMTAAGSYVGAYILGAADRHQDNVQIKDGDTMLHIDFGFVLGSTPPIDGPRFAIYPQMEKAFRDVNEWDLFVDTCERAFVAVRRMSPAVTRTCVMLFTKFGFSDSAVRDFLAGRYSLNIRESNEKAAGGLVRNQVLQSSTDWKTKFKAYSHTHVDPAFYALLERRFPPAVLAMKIVDAKEQKASKRLSKESSEKHPVSELEKVSI